MLQSVARFGACECWFLWEHQDLWGMGWLLFLWLVAQWRWNAVSFAGSGDIEAVQEQGLAASSAVPETEKPNAILWLVILVGAWGRLYLYSTELCAINRNKFSDLEGDLISLTIFLVFMFCHLGFFFSPISLDFLTWCRTTLSSCSVKGSSYRVHPEGH